MLNSERDAPFALATLRACRLFGGMDDASLELVGDALRPRHFRRGETLFHVGDPGDALYVVASGNIKITLPPEDGSEPAILTTIGPGGFFGELALLDGGRRSATAVALDAVTTLILRRDSLDRLVDDQPELRRALLAALAGEIRRLTAQVHDLYFLDLPSRLAQHLLRSLPHEPGAQEGPEAALPDGEVRLPWPYTQAELASMIGGSRQSVNRLLSEYVGAGLIRFEGDDLVIPDVHRLAAAIRR